MKILHLNTFENRGGAAIAARRLHNALNQDRRVMSLLGVKEKDSDALDVVELPCYKSKIVGKLLSKANDKLLSWYTPKANTFFSAYLLPNRLASAIKTLQPDIVHLHWLAGNFISPHVLQQIASLSIKTVWTLHDTWAFTGGCHYFRSCQKWQQQCCNCPELYNKFPLDLAKLQWKMKARAYKKLQPTVIGLSKQFAADIEQSSLFKNFQTVQLPNTIDTKIFRPIPKDIARNLLGLPADGQYILFGACSATNDPRKGYDLLKDALDILSSHSQKDIICLVFGASHSTAKSTHNFPTLFLGELHDALLSG